MLFTGGSRGPPRRPPFAPKIFFKIVHFSGNFKGKPPVLSKLWAQGSKLQWPPWQKSWICPRSFTYWVDSVGKLHHWFAHCEPGRNIIHLCVASKAGCWHFRFQMGDEIKKRKKERAAQFIQIKEKETYSFCSKFENEVYNSAVKLIFISFFWGGGGNQRRNVVRDVGSRNCLPPLTTGWKKVNVNNCQRKRTQSHESSECHPPSNVVPWGIVEDKQVSTEPHKKEAFKSRVHSALIFIWKKGYLLSGGFGVGTIFGTRQCVEAVSPIAAFRTKPGRHSNGWHRHLNGFSQYAAAAIRGGVFDPLICSEPLCLRVHQVVEFGRSFAENAIRWLPSGQLSLDIKDVLIQSLAAVRLASAQRPLTNVVIRWTGRLQCGRNSQQTIPKAKTTFQP